MRAVVLRKCGPPEVLRTESWPDPDVEPRQVLVRVLASGVCNHDVLVRSRGIPRRAFQPPQILGHEICGEIVKTGSETRALQIGDTVATLNYTPCLRCQWCSEGQETDCPQRKMNRGGYAEYVALEPGALVRVPPEIPPEHAAIVSCAIGIPLRAVQDTARVQPRETVLITGAGGGIGVHSVQVANMFGARTIALTSSPQKVARLKSIGADEVILFSEPKEFEDEVLALTKGAGVNVVLDHVGSAVFSSAFRCLGNKGRYVFIGELSTDQIQFNAAWMFRKDLILLGSGPARRRDAVDAMELVRTGKVRPIIAAQFELEQATRAHNLMESRQSFGRVVLRP